MILDEDLRHGVAANGFTMQAGMHLWAVLKRWHDVTFRTSIVNITKILYSYCENPTNAGLFCSGFYFDEFILIGIILIDCVCFQQETVVFIVRFIRRISTAFGDRVQVDEASVGAEAQISCAIEALEVFVIVDVNDFVPDKHAADFPQLSAQNVISFSAFLIIFPFPNPVFGYLVPFLFPDNIHQPPHAVVDPAFPHGGIQQLSQLLQAQVRVFQPEPGQVPQCLRQRE